MKLNGKLKVENSKFTFQNACTEISLAKAKANKFTKSEEVKSIQFVINLLAPGYTNKNNQSNSYIKTNAEKNDEPEGSRTLPVIISSFSNIDSEIEKRNIKTDLPKPILPATLTNKNL
ncbi:hypothetical protein F8M41_026013 [Gigaspora margarita]|uniref:Uncharacterized protein n=1 Tax=Gigaspora margarita TaxID=4874 RepID=A0A8H3XJH7_GIGMA|nr:hypothetical protein F8M41_026013 [Gigaspora margarita]